MAALGSLLASFNESRNPPASARSSSSPNPQGRGTPSRENTPTSHVDDDGNGNGASASGETPSHGNTLTSEDLDTSMDLDEEEDTDTTRLSALMGSLHEANAGTAHSRANYQALALQKARKYSLSSGQQDEVTEFCELSPIEMLIDIKIHCMRTDNDILHRFMRIFVRHPDFLTRVRHAVGAALLAPNIPAYVDGVTVQLTKYLGDHAEKLLGVPDAQRSDPADWALIKSAIAIELTNLRTAMKLKIDSSIKNKQDIYEITTTLMMYEMRPKKEHWGRFAFLRQCTLVYYKLTKKKRGDYWKHIDQCLADVRQSALDTYPRAEDVAARKRHETTFIAHALEKDLKDFRLKSGALARTVYTNDGLIELQSTTEKVVGAFLVSDKDTTFESEPEFDASTWVAGMEGAEGAGGAE